MALLEGGLQGIVPPLVSRGNVDPRHGQQHTHHLHMATIGSYVDRGLAILVGLVGLDPVRAEQRTHDVQVAILARDEQWCASSRGGRKNKK